jgi:P2-related tail formation protein
MPKKTIDEVRREVDRWKVKWRDEQKRADRAEQEVMVQKSRAQAYERALVAVIDDMKRLGLVEFRYGPNGVPLGYFWGPAREKDGLHGKPVHFGIGSGGR